MAVVWFFVRLFGFGCSCFPVCPGISVSPSDIVSGLAAQDLRSANEKVNICHGDHGL